MGWTLVELEDVPVRVERVEALAAGVRPRRHLDRPVGAKADALRTSKRSMSETVIPPWRAPVIAQVAACGSEVST
jgi:hypothetical protein